MCDTAVNVTPRGVLFAKNSDRDPNEAQLVAWHAPAIYAKGARVACTWIDIPQVEATRGVLLSRPFWMWGAEIGANDRGVVIGNEAVFTRARYAKTGLTGMDLLRLALERAASADEAVQTIVTLLQRHGQGGGCGHEDRSFTYHNSFLVADARGAIVLETSGRAFATERVKAGARSISNGLTIPGFAAAQSDWLKTRVSACRVRRARTEAGAARAQGVGDMMRMLRDHGDTAWPVYRWLNGGMRAPCMHAGGQITSSQTTASWVAAVGEEGARHWVTGTAAPCVSLFKPVRVDEPLDLGPAPTDVPDARSLWWRHEALHRRVLRDPARFAPRFLPERDLVEARWLASPPEPKDAWGEGDRLLAKWTAEVVGADAGARDVRPPWTRRYWRARRGLTAER
jgi:secernin